MRLERFTGNWDALHEVAMEALKLLQSCLDDKAVHGDLNPSNLLVRYVMSTGSTLGVMHCKLRMIHIAHAACIVHAGHSRVKLILLGPTC